MSLASQERAHGLCLPGTSVSSQRSHARWLPSRRPTCKYSLQTLTRSSRGAVISDSLPTASQRLLQLLPAALSCAALLLTPFPSVATPNATLEAVNGISGGLAEESAAITRSTSSREAFLDINVDGQPKGRIVISLFDDVPVASQRFMDLAQGQEGISYQLSRVAEIGPTFIRVGDLQSLSYAAQADAKIAGGDTTEQLEVELEQSRHSHSEPGTVSLVVKDNKERPVKERLVAYQGKFISVKEQLGGALPNGSGFVITTAAAPALDGTNLVLGRVVQGMDVVQQIAELPTVKANSGSPFLKVAKLAGDQRATVAEKSFGRPFKRVVISQCGAMS